MVHYRSLSMLPVESGVGNECLWWNVLLEDAVHEDGHCREHHVEIHQVETLKQRLKNVSQYT